MKKIVYYGIFILAFLFHNISYAQVKESIEHMSQGEQNAFYINIDSDNTKGIQKLWKNYFKDYGKMKKNRKEKEWATKKPVKIPENGIVEYDVYFKLKKSNEVTTAYLWASNGDNFISTKNNSEEAEKIKLMFEGFAHQSELFAIEEVLDREESKLEDLEKDLGHLEKKNIKYHKNIEKAKQDIIEWEEDIEQNMNDQEKTNEDIKNQRDRVQKVKDNLNALR